MEDNKVIQFNNFNVDPKYNTVCHIVKYSNDPKNPEIVTIAEMNDNINIINKHMEDPKAYYIIEKVIFTHTKYIIEISIHVYREEDCIEVSIQKMNLINKERTTLLEKTPYDDENPIFYVPEFGDILNLKEIYLEYQSIVGGRKFIFQDYSQTPFNYDGEGFISIDEGAKYPLSIINRFPNSNGNPDIQEIDKSNLTPIRCRYVIEEMYKGINEVYGFIPTISYYPYSDYRIIQLIKYELTGSPIIRVSENQILETTSIIEEKYIDKTNDIGFTIEKLDDKKYKITLNYDWLPDKIEIRDGFGNEYIIEKYKRLTIVK